MTKDKALKMAIEFIDEITNASGKYTYVNKTSLVEDSYKISLKLKESLEQSDDYVIICKHCGDDLGIEYIEQPAQEPVAWMSEGGIFTRTKEHAKSWSNHGGKVTPVYTHPAPSWQGLSDDEIAKVFDDIGVSTTNRKIYRAIEQELKEKNTC